MQSISPIEWQLNKLRLLDQRRLPQTEVYIECATASQVADAIKSMVVRGAPAIGITAAYGVVLAVLNATQHSTSRWRDAIEQDLQRLAASRPTAVNLRWALDRMRALIVGQHEATIVTTLLREARAIHDEDYAANQRMAKFGADLIDSRCAVLTHCNTGALATGGYGTALGVIRTAYAENKITEVYADETRPWLQGSRLTAWELVKENIPVTVIADGAAAWLMQQGKVQWFIVGADRIAANGDAANKIGTYSGAVNARRHGVKVMVVAPVSTVDLNTATGNDIPIELRNEEELFQLGSTTLAAKGAKGWNPVFDVTPAELIDVIVTERGVVEQPNREKMQQLLLCP